MFRKSQWFCHRSSQSEAADREVIRLITNIVNLPKQSLNQIIGRGKYHDDFLSTSIASPLPSDLLALRSQIYPAAWGEVLLQT